MHNSGKAAGPGHPYSRTLRPVERLGIKAQMESLRELKGD